MSNRAELLFFAKQYPRHCFADISVDHHEFGRWQYRDKPARRGRGSPTRRLSWCSRNTSTKLNSSSVWKSSQTCAAPRTRLCLASAARCRRALLPFLFLVSAALSVPLALFLLIFARF
jgi:hypothetical protein